MKKEPIDPNKFKAEIAKEFIALLSSKRGLASELSRSIGKDPAFINSIKQNKPVNALHLKAVELILGAKFVLKLLASNEAIDLNGVNSPTESYGKSANNKFKFPKKEQDAMTALWEIENIDEQIFRRTVADLEYIANKLKEGATPGPLIAVPENKTLGELTKEKDRI
nr:hypothetical protein [uncultured Desulfobacter sp.]